VSISFWFWLICFEWDGVAQSSLRIPCGSSLLFLSYCRFLLSFVFEGEGRAWIMGEVGRSKRVTWIAILEVAEQMRASFLYPTFAKVMTVNHFR